jgi:hypothetical protein
MMPFAASRSEGPEVTITRRPARDASAATVSTNEGSGHLRNGELALT